MVDLGRKFWAHLTHRERAKVVLLVLAVIIMAILEVANVSAIMPFLTVAGDPGAIREDPLLWDLYDRLGFQDENRFLVALGFGVFTLMLISNAWIAFTTWIQARFVWSWNHGLSTRLLRRYLYRPYTYFLSRNTADLSKNILSEVQQISNQLMVPAIQGLGRSVVALGIIAILFAMEPSMALMVTVIVGGAYGTIYLATRRKLNRIGAERLGANHDRFVVAAEALGGIKEVKLLGKEESFLRRFLSPSALFSRHQATSQVISQMPRYAVEPIAFGTVILLVVYLIAHDQDLGHVIPMLGFYAFAGYRLMPAVQQGFQGLSKIRFMGPALENLLREMEDEVREQRWSGAGGRTLRQDVQRAGQVQVLRLRLERDLVLRNVTFRYPSSEADAIHDVSLTIRSRTTVGLVGATGSGKTTLADLILGLLRPQSGEIRVDGVPIAEASLRAWQDNLGYVPQNIFLTDASVAENIAFGVSPEEIDMEAVRDAARTAMIHEFVMNELPRGYETVVGERGIRLSGGQRQRIGIARALYRNPSVLVFDEATSALDNQTEESVMEAIRGLLGQRTLIMIAHRLTTLKDCNVVYMLNHGRLVSQGTYKEVVAGQGRFSSLAEV